MISPARWSSSRDPARWERRPLPGASGGYLSWDVVEHRKRILKRELPVSWLETLIRFRNLIPFLRRQLDLFFRTFKREQGGFRICVKGRNFRNLITQQLGNRFSTSVAYRQLNDFWRKTFKEAQLAKIVVLGNDNKAMFSGIFPNGHIVTAAESNRTNM